MSKIIQGKGIDINRTADGTLETWEDNITISKVTVGAVKEVRITHPEMVAQIGEVKYTIPAATVSVNTVDVASFTTYYCYYELMAGVMTFVSTTTHPDMASPEPDYVWLRQIRFKSVSGTATIEFVQRQIMCHDEALHSIGDYAYLMPPSYISGFAPTISLVDGTIDVEAGNYRRITGDNRTRAAITDGNLYAPSVDAEYANLAAITKYSDGSTITAAKYVKVLVGVLVNATSDFDFIANLQDKPLTEYVSAAEAWADSEHKSSMGFSSTRRSAVLPLAWVVIKKGDASTIEYKDLRESGFAYASGGNAGVTDHGALAGLTDYVDHPGFLLADGSRPLTGNLSVDGSITIDGVDISVHAANTTIHHAPVTLSADADAVLALSTQAIDLDTQTANTILAGPVSGVAAKPAFRTISSGDISDFTEAAQDAVGGMVANSNSIQIAYVDGTPSLTATLVLKEATLSLSNSANNNVVVSGGDFFIISGPTAAFSITGIAGGTTGRMIIIHNQTAQRMTISNESASSTAANRIYTGTAADITTAASAGSTGSVTLVYSSTLSRWIVSSWIA
jgi:hypothetical protein